MIGMRFNAVPRCEVCLDLIGAKNAKHHRFNHRYEVTTAIKDGPEVLIEEGYYWMHPDCAEKVGARPVLPPPAGSRWRDPKRQEQAAQ